MFSKAQLAERTIGYGTVSKGDNSAPRELTAAQGLAQTGTVP